jgi:mannose-6-phosphate isomerase
MMTQQQMIKEKDSVIPASTMTEYKVGDSDQRPWGHYVVTAVGVNEKGEEYCDKEITVLPGQVLSLQSHELRRETWKVLRGTLTVLLDGESIEMIEGEEIHIPEKSIHCMANLSDDRDCVVFERQEGLCREEDIKRYIDAYGRGTEAPKGEAAVNSITAYNEIIAALKEAA